jgi:hypothetical protein
MVQIPLYPLPHLRQPLGAYLSDTYLVLYCMLDGTSESEQVASNSVFPTVESQNKNRIYFTGVTDTRGFLTWLRSS